MAGASGKIECSRRQRLQPSFAVTEMLSIGIENQIVFILICS